MPATKPKGLRMSDEEAAHVTALLPHFPQAQSESHLNYLQWLMGHLCYAVVATVPGEKLHGGYDPDKLAAVLERELKPVIEFLLARGRLTSLIQPPVVVTTHDGNQVDASPVVLLPGFQFDPSAADDIDGLGMESLMDD